METRLIESSLEFHHQPFASPMHLSSGVITEITEARVRVTAEVNGKSGTGHGSIYLSDLWAWPGSALPRAEKQQQMEQFCRDLASDLAGHCGGEAAHPLELGLRLHHTIARQESPLPILARGVCASPFDAAIHDAVGQIQQRSAFRFYDEDYSIPSADSILNGQACATIRRAMRNPAAELTGWWIVGAKEDLEKALRPAIQSRGFHAFKLKTLGADNAADAARVCDVFTFARNCGVARPRICIDSNEGNPHAEAVSDFLDRIQAALPECYEAIEYLEQPTGRDITLHPQNWRALPHRKPILLDEGLTDIHLLKAAEDQGWSGLALKTCKGHSFTLLCAAWAASRQLQLTMQDLTNPGYSAIHSFLMAAHLPVLNGVELNSPQFTPAANAEWLPQLAGLFNPTDGIHRLDPQKTWGLGSNINRAD